MIEKNNSILLTGTIVLFKENIVDLSKTINSFLSTPISKKLFLVDNSPTDVLKNKFSHPDIEYVFIRENIGFGAGHNRVIDRIKNLSTYHVILNPDVSFELSVIPNLIKNIEKDKELALISPKVLFPNGDHQFTSRRYPTFFELIIRNISFLKYIFPSIIKKGEYNDKDLSQPFYPDFLHGCFQLYKTECFVKLKGFDERYFLYMEDLDICRKIDKLGKKKMYYPNEEIIHILKKDSSKNLSLFFIHLKSSMKYFKKWS